MPRGRSDMKRVKEVLRLAHELGCSNRQIQDSVRLGRTTVSTYLARARNAGVRYADVAEMSEATLEGRCLRALSRPQPDWSGVAAEMLWQEYRAAPRRLQLQPVPSLLPGASGAVA